MPIEANLRRADALLGAANEQLGCMGILRSFLSPDEQEVLLERDSPDGQYLFREWHDRTAEFRTIELDLTAQLNFLGGNKMESSSCCLVGEINEIREGRSNQPGAHGQPNHASVRTP
ncbi:hypothetical protein BDV93DRAFT_567289 [Ceratobasidium sp. AG-I]|nr:hypothetical protein BDV93DRAFT_567289 [Ceratobasidium sp. AG-I]